MNATHTTARRGVRWGSTAGLLAAGAIAGGVLAGTLGADAATTTTGGAPPANARGSMPAHGSAAEEALEKPVTGANATKAQAAAVKALGGGTAGAVTTDSTGNGYEVTVTKTDGSTTEVHLDGSFAVAQHGPAGG